MVHGPVFLACGVFGEIEGGLDVIDEDGNRDRK